MKSLFTAFLTVVISFSTNFSRFQLSANDELSPLQLDEKILPLKPVKKITEEQQDRLYARVMFATGRILENNRKYHEALRHYQRVVRYDSTADDVRYDLVRLAYGLDYLNDASRYAVGFHKTDSYNPLLLHELSREELKKNRLPSAIKLAKFALEGFKSRGKGKNRKEIVQAQLDLGRLYAVNSQYKEAAKVFTEILAIVDNPTKHGLTKLDAAQLLKPKASNYIVFGESFFQAGEMSQAEKLLSKANDAKPNPTFHAFSMARIYYKQKKMKQALKALHKYFDANSQAEGSLPYELLAKIYKDTKKSNDLIPKLEELYRKNSKNHRLGYFLASTYLKAKKTAQAIKLYENLIQKKPMFAGYRSLVSIYHRDKKPEQTLTTVANFLFNAGAGDLKLLNQPGKDLLADVSFLEKILQVSEKRLKQKDHSLNAKEAIAAAYIAKTLKKKQKTNQFYELALKDKKVNRNDVLRDWAIDLIVDGNNKKAIEVLLGAKSDDKTGLIAYLLAAVYSYEKQFDKARAAAIEARKKRPSSVRFAAREAWVLWQERKYDQASKLYQVLIKKFDKSTQLPDNREALKDAKSIMSTICVQQKNYKQAEEWLQQVLDEFPNDIGAFNDLGYLWADQNKHLNRAQRMIQTAVKADPKNKAYRDSLGWVYFRKGKYKEALQELNLAFDGNDDDGEILDHLAEVHLKLGDKKKAISYWKKAKSIYEKEKLTEKMNLMNQKIQKLNRSKSMS